MTKLKAKKTGTTPKTVTFATGQKWQMERGHAEIVHVGKSLVQYRFLKTGIQRGTLEMQSIPNFAASMKNHKATLVAG